MLGIPNVDINKIRNSLVKKYNFKEPYVNNIIHSTLLRFTDRLHHDEIKYLQMRISSLINFGKTYITQYHFGKASWLMNQNNL